MLRALLERGIAPDLVVGTSVGAINGAAIATEPTVAMVAAARRDLVGHRAQRRLRRLAARPAGDARPHPHAPARQRRAAGDADRGAADRADRGPAGALRVRRGEHRARRRALVHRRAAGRRGARLRGGARASCRRSRSAASTSSTAGSSTRSRSTARSRSAPTRIFVMHVGRAGPPAGAAALAVGGRAGRVRDRAPAPLPRRSRVAAGRRRGARDADRPARGAEVQRPLGAALPRSARTSARASSARTPPRVAYLDEHGL